MAFGNTASHPSSPYWSRIKTAYDSVCCVPTPALTQINPGDLILLNSGVAAVMSALAWDASTLQTQTDAAPLFLGISLDQKNAADPTTRPIAVVTRGIAVYPCAAISGAKHIGDYVAAAADGTHNLYDQQVAICSGVAGAIGKLQQEVLDGALQLVFYFQSTLIYGKVNAAA